MKNMATLVITISQDMHKINARMNAMSSKVESLIINEGKNSTSMRNLDYKWDSSPKCCKEEFKVCFLVKLK